MPFGQPIGVSDGGFPPSHVRRPVVLAAPKLGEPAVVEIVKEAPVEPAATELDGETI